MLKSRLNKIVDNDFYEKSLKINTFVLAELLKIIEKMR